MFIYLITNKINDKKYVGATSRKNVQQRWREHISQAKRGSKNYFHSALRKHGKDNFIFEVLEELHSVQELHEMEIFYINLFKTRNRKMGYNLCIGGDSRIGYKLSQKTKKILSERLVGNKNAKGMVHTEEWKRNHSLMLSGENNYFYGKTHSDDTKQKISLANTGKKRTSEHKQKISESSKGRLHTEETKRKMSDSKKGLKKPKHVIDNLIKLHLKPIIQFTRFGVFIREFESMKEVVNLGLISYSTLGKALKQENGIGEANGYIWKYKSTYTSERLEEIKREAIITS